MKQLRLKSCLNFAIAPCLLAWSYAFADGVETHIVESQYQNGEQEIRVLLPDDYRKEKYYPVVYVLPAEKGFDDKYGYGLGVLEQMHAHNKYDIIIVQMGFEKEPWYGNHATDLKTRQASYVKEFVVPFVERRYSATATPRGRLLLGFSKSAWGAFSLILTYPEFFGYAASWDAPMFFDKFHYKMKPVYGTLDQLNRFRPDLLVPKRKRHFQDEPRLVLTGEQGWGKSIPAPNGKSHTVFMHELLEEYGVKHFYDNTLEVPHRWNEQWMGRTLEALMGLMEDPITAYNRAVKAAEELKSRIELDEKPWSDWRLIIKGTIDLVGDGKKSVVGVVGGGLNFWTGRTLSIKTPGKPEGVGLFMYWDGYDMYHPAHLSWSINADDPLYAPERRFLDRLKYAYDYMPEDVILAQPDNPEYAVHFWGKDNGAVQEGRLIIRRHKGKPAGGLAEDELHLEDGSFIFARSSRGALYAYDRRADEHFLLFHCNSKYNGPYVLAKAGSWLLIGLWGEGLVAVDLDDYYLKRFSAVAGTVEKIEVTGSEIVIDDGRHRIPLPIERSREKARSFYFGPRSAK